MIGRAAQGKPWIFREINHFLKTGQYLAAPSLAYTKKHAYGHVAELHHFYGDFMGVRIARKHVSWYMQVKVQLSTVLSLENG
jgi:tRNA-dihydrouridine synthase B